MFFSTGDGADCGEVSPFTRTVPAQSVGVQAALASLLGGPNTDESAAGAGSLFSAETADISLRTQLAGGVLTVDFTGLTGSVPNASTSCGTEALLAQLNATVLQFPDIDRVRYQSDGSCEALMNWLQRECVEFDAEGSVGLSLAARADGSGCLLGDTATLTGRFYGLVTSADETSLTFDAACWFSGAAAAEAATADGQESPPPNDYYVRNSSATTRTLPVEATAEVDWYIDPGDPSTRIMTGYPDWAADRDDRAFQPGAWLDIVDGTLMAIDEQYTP